MSNGCSKYFPSISRFHSHNQIYLDSAATSLTPQSVIETMTQYYNQMPVSNHSGYDLAMELDNQIEFIREEIKVLFKAKDYHHIFSSSATDSFNKLTAMYRSILNNNDTILISLYEHHSNLLPWIQLSESIGCKVVFYKPDKNGILDTQILQGLIFRHTPKILTLTGCSNINGYCPDLQDISNLCQKYMIDLIIDGTQHNLYQKEGLDELQPTVYINSWHKLYGPKGVGSMFINKSSQLNQCMGNVGGGIVTTVSLDDIGYLDSPYRFEPGTANFASILALAPTVEFVRSIDIHQVYFNQLSQYTYQQLLELDFVRLVPATNPNRGIFSLQLNGCNSFDVGQFLNSNKIMVRSGKMCAQPILDFFGFEDIIRVSLGVYNCKEEVQTLVQNLKKAFALLHSK
jgi:selenocysteine lyase/cysteine desulfurase